MHSLCEICEISYYFPLSIYIELYNEKVEKNKIKVCFCSKKISTNQATVWPVTLAFPNLPSGVVIPMRLIYVAYFENN